jgi:hypothetical protein
MTFDQVAMSNESRYIARAGSERATYRNGCSYGVATELVALLPGRPCQRRFP